MIIGYAGLARTGKDEAALETQRVLGRDTTLIHSLGAPVKAFMGDWLGFSGEHLNGALKEIVQIHRLSTNHNTLPSLILKHFGKHPTHEMTEYAIEKIVKLMVKEFVDNGHVLIDASDTNMAYLNISPRQSFQKFGTDVMKEGFDNLFWLDYLKCYDTSACNLVVADIRFEDEAEYVRKLGGTIVHINRPKAARVEPHKSEYGISHREGDKFIDNNQNLIAFQRKVRIMLDDMN